jgi:hypothetical protein
VRGSEQSRRQFIDGIMAVSRFLHCAATYASDSPAKGHSGRSERFVASPVGRSPIAPCIVVVMMIGMTAGGAILAMMVRLFVIRFRKLRTIRS